MFLYFVSDDLPYLKCPLHTVMKLTPVAYGGLDSCFLTFANIHMEILFTNDFELCFRLQSGNVLSECGGSEYT